jgi:hypothetical protein
VNLSDAYCVVRTFAPGRPVSGRWEVFDAAGVLVGIVAEEPTRRGCASTFTAVHNPTATPFRPPAGRRLRALGAWSSGGHPTVPAAVKALGCHLADDARPPLPPV